MQIHYIYCGLLSSEGTQEDMAQVVRELAIQFFPTGHTIHEAQGRWKGLSGPVDEQTLIVEGWEVAGFGKPPYTEFAGAYKNQAKQEAVVIHSLPTTATVI